MPIYEIESKDGRIIEIEGDRPPDRKTIEEAFSRMPNEPKSVTEEPPINENTPRFTDEQMKSAISKAQLAGSFTLFSPATEFAGETAKALIDDEKLNVALKRGATAAGIDLGIRLMAGGLPSPLVKGGSKQLSKISPELAKKLSNSTLANKGLVGKTGEFLTKQKLVQPGYSQEVVDEVIKNPKLMQSSKQSIGDLSQKAFKSIKKLKKDLGEIVGKAKQEAGLQDITIDTKPLIVKIENIKKDLKFKPDKGKLGRSDTKGEKAIDTVLEAVQMKSNKATKKTLKISNDGIMSMVKNKNKSSLKPTIENMQMALDNIDASPSFQKIYNIMQSPNASLTFSQKKALEMRNNVRDAINNSVESVLDTSGLSSAKANYSSLVKTLDSPEIKVAGKSADALAKKLKQSLTETNEGVFRKFKDIDSALPDNEKFLDKTFNILIGREMNNLGLSDILNFNFKKPVLSTSALAGKQMLKEKSVPKTLIGGVTRRGAIEAQKELSNN